MTGLQTCNLLLKKTTFIRSIKINVCNTYNHNDYYSDYWDYNVLAFTQDQLQIRQLANNRKLEFPITQGNNKKRQGNYLFSKFISAADNISQDSTTDFCFSTSGKKLY